MQEAFSRTAMLLGEHAIKLLSQKRVAIFGLGGVGGYVMEGLVRSGIGALELIDSDSVAPSNLNRQILATTDSIGQTKVQAGILRARSINPGIQISARELFYLPDTADTFDFSSYDYVVDAVDTVSAKLSLILACKQAGTPIICAMGAGNKLDPTRFEVADIYQTSVCPLARVMRGLCRKNNIRHLKVVYSKEEPIPASVPDENGIRRATPGSVAFVPSVMGLIIAGEVVKALIQTGI